jgi:AMP nucleosidase
MTNDVNIPAKRGEWVTVSTADDVVATLCAIYKRSADNLRDAFAAFVEKSEAPDQDARDAGAFAYPLLRMTYMPDGPAPAYSRAFGKFDTPGVYESDITNPEIYADYLREQIGILLNNYECQVEIGLSGADIPYPYVLESGKGVDTDIVPPSELARLFPVPDLAAIDDSIPNGDWIPEVILDHDRSFQRIKPLGLFSALRTDYSLQRLKHYTGTDPADIQQFILFTNYQRYMDEFVDIAVKKLREDDIYEELVAPGGVRVTAETKDAGALVAAAPWRKHQMPAYHLKAKGGQGITLVNIGVGPSNAKTITDHLAVLRPQCWIMVGHCGGLRHSQRLGDYVLAHAYLRYDGVLDQDLPPEIPVPPIAEIQLALTAAAKVITGDAGSELKSRLRTGTVVTNDDRNWELRFSEEAHRFNQSRAIAVDMESATLAANGYRFRVPYGTLLCVSDKPLHGEIKLPGAANRFYEKAISEHMLIGIEALESLRRDGADALHSRKLRSFEEPPFR